MSSASLRRRARRALADVGRRIAELRRSRGLSQAEFAEAAGLDLRTVQRLEAGAVTTTARLFNVAEVLGVSLRDLFEPPAKVVPRKPGRPRTPAR